MTNQAGEFVNIIANVHSEGELSTFTDVGPYRYYKVSADITVGSDQFVIDDVISKVNGVWKKVTYDVTNDFEVYVGGTRLKKDQYMQYTDTNYPYSPEGDTMHSPEYTVNQNGYFVKLLTPAPKGLKLTVVKKTGKEWISSTEKLTTANNPIAEFIRSAEAIWPQYLVDKYQYILSSDSDFTLESDDEVVIELD
jgi:hypothetical protein